MLQDGGEGGNGREGCPGRVVKILLTELELFRTSVRTLCVPAALAFSACCLPTVCYAFGYGGDAESSGPPCGIEDITGGLVGATRASEKLNGQKEGLSWIMKYADPYKREGRGSPKAQGWGWSEGMVAASWPQAQLVGREAGCTCYLGCVSLLLAPRPGQIQPEPCYLKGKILFLPSTSSSWTKS